MTHRILLVVPTLGTRHDLLEACLRSIRSQSTPAEVAIVSPPNPAIRAFADSVSAQWVEDPKGGLAAAINAGVRNAQGRFDYLSWLGDDDLLTDDSLAHTSHALDESPTAVLAYGPCIYIDAAGTNLWTNSAPPWVVPVLRWGPQLVPQPGMLVRSTTWNEVGGLDESYSMAFDFDLLLRLKKRGHFVRVDQPVSCFRWHADSLTVDDRNRNLRESERAKRAALSPSLRRIAWLWEPPVRWATRLAASRVQARARRAVMGSAS